jgi:hypothetical protein
MPHTEIKRYVKWKKSRTNVADNIMGWTYSKATAANTQILLLPVTVPQNDTLVKWIYSSSRNESSCTEHSKSIEKLHWDNKEGESFCKYKKKKKTLKLHTITTICVSRGRRTVTGAICVKQLFPFPQLQCPCMLTIHSTRLTSFAHIFIWDIGSVNTHTIYMLPYTKIKKKRNLVSKLVLSHRINHHHYCYYYNLAHKKLTALKFPWISIYFAVLTN